MEINFDELIATQFERFRTEQLDAGHPAKDLMDEWDLLREMHQCVSLNNEVENHEERIQNLEKFIEEINEIGKEVQKTLEKEIPTINAGT